MIIWENFSIEFNNDIIIDDDTLLLLALEQNTKSEMDAINNYACLKQIRRFLLENQDVNPQMSLHRIIQDVLYLINGIFDYFSDNLWELYKIMAERSTVNRAFLNNKLFMINNKNKIKMRNTRLSENIISLMIITYYYKECIEEVIMNEKFIPVGLPDYKRRNFRAKRVAERIFNDHSTKYLNV